MRNAYYVRYDVMPFKECAYITNTRIILKQRLLKLMMDPEIGVFDDTFDTFSTEDFSKRILSFRDCVTITNFILIIPEQCSEKMTQQ